MPSKCCNAVIDRDDDGDLICTECLGLCELDECDFDDFEFQGDRARLDWNPLDDKGGTGHGDDSYSDAEPNTL